jgi:hypothetical protein
MITPSFSLTATERVLPKLALDFTTASLDSRITFTRTGATATRVNASGLVETMAANTPRFDFNPTTLGCKGLLIEEARTNLILRSSDFATTWVADGATVSSNVAISPDGTQNADLISAAANNWRMRQDVAVTGLTTYICSAFVKKGNSTTVKFEFATSGGINPSVTGNLYYNFNTNTITGTGSVTSPTVTSYGNGWFRISGGLTPSLTHITMSVYCYGGAEYGSAGQTNWWGVQTEAGAFVTSYIPTVAAAVTRNADVATMTGANFSDWYNASEGAAVIQALPSTISNTRPAIQLDDNTANESIALRGVAADPQLFVVDGGSPQATLDAGTITANTVYKLGGAWKASSFATAINGAAAVTSASGTLPTVTQARLGSDGTNYFNGHLQNLRYWPQRLTNAEVQAFSK